MPHSFVHLHVHSHYTLLESTNTVGKLVARTKELGMDALALTDRGNCFGALDFQVKALDAGIRPILGCQVNMAPLGMKEKARDMHQLVLLCMSNTGYRNLAQLVSYGWLEGFYYEPRVDLDLLRQFSEDLICLTGAGSYGYLNVHLSVGAKEEAQRRLEELQQVFDDRLYVELCDSGTGESKELVESNLALARETGVPVVATNWAHYLRAEDAESHDVQLAVQKVTTLDDPRRRRMPSHEFYLKSPEEMTELFADTPDAISNTALIAERCAGRAEASTNPDHFKPYEHIVTGVYHLPKFDCPDGMSESDYLRTLCEEGMSERYGDDISDEHRERLQFELDTIIQMGFPGYFLIVQDFINWAKQEGIPVGPGRGSAAGSLVAYSLGITDLCPMRYGLLFERFLNPGRISMPDIDVDFCKDRRGDVIRYTADKYGQEAVTQIMTLGTMKARMAIKDVCRAYHWTPEEAQELANLIPEDPSGKHTIPVCLGLKDIKGELDPSPKLVARYNGDERTKQVLDTAMQLENLGRSLGIHACGIIIAPGPVHEYVPVCSVKGKPATQFNMSEVEECGLLKMDFLGLKTMSILKKAADIVKATEGVDIDYPTLPLNDPTTFELLGTGETLGVFQCESTGFQELIKLLKPDRFEDLIALVALYRPGPLSAGMHLSYCNRKHGREAVSYPHPVLEEVLSETYGLYIYQEQVMNISRELCGFSQSDADNLRKAMGKKKLSVLEKMKPQFIEGAFERHGFPREDSEAMWNDILGFAAYCFNKSHSACYAQISYWTAYMKANYFPAFMTANLIYEMGDKDKMTLFVRELAKREIPVLPPDINESGWEFTWTGEAVRFGFGGIKGVGSAAAEHLIAVRENSGRFPGLYELFECIEHRKVNKRVIEHIIKVGGFETLHDNRKALASAIDRAHERGVRLAKLHAQSQTTMFDTFEEDEGFREQTTGYPAIDDWSPDEKLDFEKSLTGYWMSSHPLKEHLHELDPYATHISTDLAKRPPGTISIAAVIIGKRIIKTRKGNFMAVLKLEDLHGSFEAVLFGGRTDRRGQRQDGAFEKFADESHDNMVALFSGKVDSRQKNNQRPAPNASSSDDADAEIDIDANLSEQDAERTAPEDLPSIIIDDIVPVHLLRERLTAAIEVLVDGRQKTEEQIRATERLLRSHPGSCPLTALVYTPDDVLLTMELGERWSVHPNDEVLDGLERIWGPRRVRPKLRQTA